MRILRFLWIALLVVCTVWSGLCGLGGLLLGSAFQMPEGDPQAGVVRDLFAGGAMIGFAICAVTGGLLYLSLRLGRRDKPSKDGS